MTRRLPRNCYHSLNIIQRQFVIKKMTLKLKARNSIWYKLWSIRDRSTSTSKKWNWNNYLKSKKRLVSLSIDNNFIQ